MSVKLVCLLPARNAAADLPEFFSSVARFADAVVALDDGSTDNTGELLSAEPLVARVISNRRRTDFRDWNDAANRNLLLAAAADLSPDWIISVDADERIPEDDAIALRRFLETDALPGIAYGFRCYSMVGDLDHMLPTPIWVYRLFAFHAGEHFPDQALHFAPIPTSVSRQAYLRTTFRIQHLGGMSPTRRLARYEKYRQADPECKFWPDYSTLLNEPAPDSVQTWKPRDPGTPTIYSGEFEAETDVAVDASNGPWLGVIVLDDGPIHDVKRALDSIPMPHDANEIEVLLVTARREVTGARPDVTIVDCQPNSTRGAMRNIGLRASSAKHVLYLGTDRSLLPGALESIAEAHRIGYASVTGVVESEAAGARQTATFLYRFGGDRPRRNNTVLDGAPRWASCSRSLLLENGGFLESLPNGEEIVLARTLATRGYLTYSIGAPLLNIDGDSMQSIVDGAVNAFYRGVANGRFFRNEYIDRGELLNRGFIREQLLRQMPRRMSRAVARARTQSASPPGRTATIAATFELAQWIGQWFELIRPQKGKALALLGRPGGVALIVIRRPNVHPVTALIRFDLRTPALKVAVLPAGLCVPSAKGEWITLESALLESEDGLLRRFAAQDLIGRPFELDLDDLIWLDTSSLPANLRTRLADWSEPAAQIAELSQRFSPATCWALWSAFRREQSAGTTLSPRALWLALLRLRSLDSSNVSLITLPGAGANLDAEMVELAQSFLEIDTIRRPATRRNQLKHVEWA